MPDPGDHDRRLRRGGRSSSAPAWLTYERLAFRVRKAAADVEWRLGSRAVRADRSQHTIELADGGAPGVRRARRRHRDGQLVGVVGISMLPRVNSYPDQIRYTRA